MDKLLIYTQIKQLKKRKFTNKQIAEQIGVCRQTVAKYAQMTDDELVTWMAGCQTRKQKLDKHHQMILDWLREYPNLTASQIHDWLEEQNIQNISESTVRRYVKQMKEDYQIKATQEVRQYEAVPDPPMGEQVQVDFGEKKVRCMDNKVIKLYVISFVMSHSRYKYMEWLTHPFTAADAIHAHQNAFRYFGGKPKQMVYDQDRVFFVNENAGDILYTEAFDAYRRVEPFEVYACRAADPESKGRIENVIKFIKRNFAEHRVFTNIEQWNEEAIQWLVRKGNGKRHNTTKQIPAKVFEKERKHLFPDASRRYPLSNETETIKRIVRKDNTILYKANRYSLPLGTYSPEGKELLIHLTENRLSFVDPVTGEKIAQHMLSEKKGQLIQDRAHTRNWQRGIPEMTEHIIHQCQNLEVAKTYCQALTERYPRYIRDQLTLILNLLETHGSDKVGQAMEFCQEMDTYSANDLKHSLNYLFETPLRDPLPKTIHPLDSIPVDGQTRRQLTQLSIEKRTLQSYQQLLGGVTE